LIRVDRRLTISSLREEEFESASGLIVAAIERSMPGYYPPGVIAALQKGNSPANVAARQSKQDDFLATLGGQPVGVLGIKRNEIGHLFVAPTAAGQGVGRRLVAFAADRFAAAGHRDMVVMSSLNAVGFYGRYGFVVEREGSFPVGRGLPLRYVWMRAPVQR
jgi:putative acetyltransferase